MPRSGTTLTCYLFNKLPDTVALFEPMNPQKMLKGYTRTEVLDKVDQFFNEQKESLLSENSAITKYRDNRVPDNPIPNKSELDEKQKRKSQTTKGKLVFDKTITPDTTLLIKHPQLFTALLPEIQERHKVYIVIRNPLACLLSWNSVEFPVSKGRLPTAEFLDADLAQTLDETAGIISKQAVLFKWFYEKYKTFGSLGNFIYYEDLIETGGNVLAKIMPSASNLQEDLSSRNKSKSYDTKLVEIIYEKLKRKYTADYEQIFPFEKITQLKNDLGHGRTI